MGKIISLHEYLAMPEPRPRARFEQTNTRSHGEIVEVSSNYDVWTRELTRDYPQGKVYMRKMWWCGCGTHQVELLDDGQIAELKITSNM